MAGEEDGYCLPTGLSGTMFPKQTWTSRFTSWLLGVGKDPPSCLSESLPWCLHFHGLEDTGHFVSAFPADPAESELSTTARGAVMGLTCSQGATPKCSSAFHGSQGQCPRGPHVCLFIPNETHLPHPGRCVCVCMCVWMHAQSLMLSDSFPLSLSNLCLETGSVTEPGTL